MAWIPDVAIPKSATVNFPIWTATLFAMEKVRCHANVKKNISVPKGQPANKQQPIILRKNLLPMYQTSVLLVFTAHRVPVHRRGTMSVWKVTTAQGTKWRRRKPTLPFDVKEETCAIKGEWPQPSYVPLVHFNLKWNPPNVCLVHRVLSVLQHLPKHKLV